MKKNFPLRQRVRIVNTGGDASIEGQCGYILGKSCVNVCDLYIVMLDNPTDDSIAISMPEGCLEIES